jgi:hypothetical protein
VCVPSGELRAPKRNAKIALDSDTRQTGTIAFMRVRVASLATCVLLSAKLGFAQAVCQIPKNPSADFGKEVTNCVNSLPSSGGTIDATNIAGSAAQNCSSSFTLQQFMVLKLAAGTVISGTCTITMKNESAIEGDGSTGSYADGTAAAVRWFYTATSGNFLSIADNAYQIRLSKIRFIGAFPLTGGSGSGDGLYASPSRGNSTVGLTLDHVTFQQFFGDGIHLIDNVYFVDCFGCAATQNGGYGWYQAPGVTSTAPSQVNLYSVKLNSNGKNGSNYGQLYAGGGASAGEIKIFGGTIANDLDPAAGTESSCLTFAANSKQQMNAWIDGAHIEYCGQSTGGQFIDWNVANGVLSVHDDYFINPSGMPAYPVNLDASFNGYAYIGPGNLFSTPSQSTAVYNTNGATTGVVELYDQIASVGGSIPSYLSGFGFLNNSFAYPTYIFGQKRFALNNAGLYFTGGGQSYSVFSNSRGSLWVTDANGNNIAEFNPSGGATALYQPVQIGDGSNVVYRCTTAGSLPAGTLTITPGNCGASVDTFLRVK